MKKALLTVLCLMSASAFSADCPEGRLFAHESGETCVADAPKRIVVLEYSFADHLGVIGETPVGYAKDAMPSYLEAIVVDATVVGTRKAPSLESIAALKPDLIIADKKRHTSLYGQLSAIAPTLIHNSLRGNYQDQLDSLKQIAAIANKSEKAATAITDLEQKIIATKEKSHANNIIIGVFRPGAIHAHSDQSFMGSLMTRTGKESSLKVRDGQTQYLLDIEGIAAVNPDAIIMMCSESSQEAFDSLLKHPVFSALKAVKNQNLYTVSKNLWSKGRGVLGLTQVLEQSMAKGILMNSASTSIKCIN